MDADLLAEISAEAAANPQGRGTIPVLLNRVLLADGDALAYAVAGNDETPAGTARHNLFDRIASAQHLAGAWGAKILTTAPSSNKGFRFAIARSKPYQGHRKGSRKPKNYPYLRSLLESGAVAGTEMTTTVEADDLFGKFATELGAENVVHYADDKDMRMLPGWHMDWKTHTMHFVPEGTWEINYNDKVFGRKWFWLQMLHGDSVDNIPGLPMYNGKKVGPVTAEKLLSMVDSDDEAYSVVASMYRSTYGDRWLVEMLEQAVLLWLRRDKYGNWLDVTQVGNPMQYIWRSNHEDAIKELLQRIKGSH